MSAYSSTWTTIDDTNYNIYIKNRLNKIIVKSINNKMPLKIVAYKHDGTEEVFEFKKWDSSVNDGIEYMLHVRHVDYESGNMEIDPSEWNTTNYYLFLDDTWSKKELDAFSEFFESNYHGVYASWYHYKKYLIPQEGPAPKLTVIEKNEISYKIMCEHIYCNYLGPRELGIGPRESGLR